MTTKVYVALIVAQSIGYFTGRVAVSRPILGMVLSALFSWWVISRKS